VLTATLWVVAVGLSLLTDRLVADSGGPTGLGSASLSSTLRSPSGPRAWSSGPAPNAATDRSEPGAMTFRAYPGRTLMARAMTRIAMTSDRVDWTIMVSLAQRLTGRVSVGLKAVALV
jgi:hypothetical protein